MKQLRQLHIGATALVLILLVGGLLPSVVNGQSGGPGGGPSSPSSPSDSSNAGIVGEGQGGAEQGRIAADVAAAAAAAGGSSGENPTASSQQKQTDTILGVGVAAASSPPPPTGSDAPSNGLLGGLTINGATGSNSELAKAVLGGGGAAAAAAAAPATDSAASASSSASPSATATTTTTTLPKPPVPPPTKPKVPQAEVNYAAEKAGAVVLQSSDALVGAKNLLDDDKDKYARSPCDQPKWVIINLSEDIRVHAIILANYEKFSSMVKDFQVLFSVKSPSLEEDSDDWTELGKFQAKEKGGEQRFEVDPPRYARYLKFRLLTHWSHEFYCTLSQIKVHGSTLQQGFMDDWQKKKLHLGNHLEVLDSGAAVGATTTTTTATPPAANIEEDISTTTASCEATKTCGPTAPNNQTETASAAVKKGGTSGGSDGGGVGQDSIKAGGEGRSNETETDTCTPASSPHPISSAEGSEGEAGGRTCAETGKQPEQKGTIVPPPPPTDIGDKVIEGSKCQGEAGSKEKDVDDVPSRPGDGTCASLKDSPSLSRKIASTSECEKEGTVSQQEDASEATIIPSPPCSLDASSVGDSEEKPSTVCKSTSSTIPTSECKAVPVSCEGRKEDSLLTAGSSCSSSLPTSSGNIPMQGPTTSDVALNAKGEGAAAGTATINAIEEEAVMKARRTEGEGSNVPSTLISKTQTIPSDPASIVPQPLSIPEHPISSSASSTTEENARIDEKNRKEEGDVLSPPAPQIVIVPPAEQQLQQQVAAGAQEVSKSALPSASIADNNNAPVVTTAIGGSNAPVSTQSVKGFEEGGGGLVENASIIYKVVAEQAVPIGSSSTIISTTPAPNGASIKSSSIPIAHTEMMSRIRNRCLEQLGLADFKKEKLAKLQEDVQRKGGPTVGGSPYDNIFKTLMDEITSLEINQSIFDVYVSNLHSCFVAVVDELRVDQELSWAASVASRETFQRQVKELVDSKEELIQRVNRLESNLLASMAACFISLVSVLLLVLLWCTSQIGLRKQKMS